MSSVLNHNLRLFLRHYIMERIQRRYHSSKEIKRLLRNPNAIVAVNNHMRAVKLCSKKIKQFLNGRALVDIV